MGANIGIGDRGFGSDRDLGRFAPPTEILGISLFWFSILPLLMGCGALENGRRWAEDATLFPGVDRIRSAAVKAVGAPSVWAPAAGAVIFGVGDLDERVSDWASDKTPIFGSREAANKASDNLLAATKGGFWLTALAAPSGPEPGGWLISKLKGVGVEYGALKATGLSVTVLKKETGRERPDGSDTDSFPSRHSSSAFAHANLGIQTVDFLSLSRNQKTAIQAGFTTLAIGTAWARVEAQKHFPSDVLAGAALANFITTFIYHAFLGLEKNERLVLFVEPSQKGLIVVIGARF